MSVIAVLITTCAFGNSFWDITIFGGWKVRHAVLCASMIGSAYQVFGYVNVIMHGGVGKNGSTIAVSENCFF
ncbi:unnamed protein product [Nippostrongylus brasiliensis]|uniref:Ammonium_transp domain-containing protein n=1 Tax=Nippostrongylus brasiliensis TaxID=27835 RepID=A0A0N4XSJ4_NIPBR|nr:unnamed protein product [Nippostrongylus brasiliensis]